MTNDRLPPGAERVPIRLKIANKLLERHAAIQAEQKAMMTAVEFALATLDDDVDPSQYLGVDTESDPPSIILKPKAAANTSGPTPGNTLTDPGAAPTPETHATTTGRSPSALPDALPSA